MALYEMRPATDSMSRRRCTTEVVTKGGKVMQGKIDPKGAWSRPQQPALAPRDDSPALLVTEAGKAISYWGARMIWRRIQKRSGVK